MAKHFNQQKQSHRCSECGHGVFDLQFKNLSLTGEPTLVICPFTNYKHVVSEIACEKFILK